MSDYEDILHRERPVSANHIPMPLADRAAQFAPFAALTGYDGAIRDTAKLQEEEVALEIEHELLEDGYRLLMDSD